ncbi:MAG: SDR family oxidoreductase [Chitinophagaceae bacterium]
MGIRFQDKIVVITGGSSGIGKALVKQFILLDAYVATCARNKDKMAVLCQEIASERLITCLADISKQEDCQRFQKEVILQFGKVDILIHNAGISMKGLVEDTMPSVINQLMNTNFLGVVQCNYEFLPYLIKSQGTIVGISSIGGSVGLPGRAGYSASKFALQGWMEAFRIEMFSKKVHVMWIQPNFVESNIRYEALGAKGEKIKTTFLDEKKIMSANICAQIIIKSIAQKRRTKLMTLQGRIILLLRKFLPILSDKVIQKFYFKKGILIK